MQKGKKVIFTFKADSKVDIDKLMNLIQSNKNRLLFTQSATPYLTYKLGEAEKIDINLFKDLLGQLI